MAQPRKPIKSKPVDQIQTLKVLDSRGTAISLGEIFRSQPESSRRILVVFIRHFFCGNCQEYIRRLATELDPLSLPDDLSVVIVGCGAPSLIQSYIEITACPFPVYADPSTQLYQALGMHRSLSLGPKGPAYIQHSLAAGMLKSIVQGVKRIPLGDVMQAGDLSVNGGEFLFERDVAQTVWSVGYSHRMTNSRDHLEIDELKTVLKLRDDEGSISTIEIEKAAAYEERRANRISRSLSMRRQTWLRTAGNLARSPSLRRSVVQVH